METCKARSLLESKKIRITGKRVEVLEAIIQSEKPVDATYLHDAAGGKETLDLATVYRALKTLKEHNLIREVLNADGIQFYELACVHNPVHPHFRCTSCGAIECLPPLPLEQTIPLTNIGTGTVHEISLTLSGQCHQCKD